MGWVAAGLAPRLILPSKAKEVKLFVFIVLQTPSLSVPDRRGLCEEPILDTFSGVQLNARDLI